MNSPYINRFLQPDSFIPNPGDPQNWNRFSYVLNNPIRYNDPSGHTSACVGATVDPECNGGHDNWTMPFISSEYGVLFTENWEVRNRGIVGTAVQDVANALLRDYNQSCGWSDECPAYSAAELFRAAYDTSESNPLMFQWGCSECNGGGGYTYSSHKIGFASLAEATTIGGGYKTDAMAYTEAVNNVVHELGHAFANRWSLADGGYDNRGPYGGWIQGTLISDEGFYLYPGPTGAKNTWRQHPCSWDPICQPNEVFADMFLGWTYGTYADDIAGVGAARRNFMDRHMTPWIVNLISP